MHKVLTKQMQHRERTRLRSRVRDDFIQGKSEVIIASRLRISVQLVHELIGEVIDGASKRLAKHREAIQRGEPLCNPWLDPMDDANVEKYWVPTPEEIETSAELIRDARLAGDWSIAGIRYWCKTCGRAIKGKEVRCRVCYRAAKRTTEEASMSCQES